jgi:hypothetical protein
VLASAAAAAMSAAAAEAVVAMRARLGGVPTRLTKGDSPSAALAPSERDRMESESLLSSLLASSQGQAPIISHGKLTCIV